MKLPIFFFVLLLGTHCFADVRSSQETVQAWATQENWAGEKQWLKLLHFEKTNLGFLRSQVDGDDFFFSPDGKKSAAAELQATLAAFYAPLSKEASEKEQFRPACRFPARYSWLKKKIAAHKDGAGVSMPTVPCPRFQHFLETLRGPSVSLVFSSYYLNNPSSAFGHTFIRVNKAPAQDGHRYELLDYGLNYAANMDSSNAVMYAIKGLFGMFRGTFTTTPYYYKVREYSNAESRDLWEYELNVTPETVDHVIEHLWELGPTQINYWYLSENCSYHMFSILEAADANIDLTSKLKSNVIPSDTVQVAWATPGLVKSVHFRPSIRTELMTRASQLSQAEIDEVLAIVKTNELSPAYSSMTVDSKARVLDTAIDYIDFKYAYDVQVADSKPVKMKNKLLSYRSQLDVVSAPLKVTLPELEKPHEAHGSVRMGLGYQTAQSSEHSYLFNYKFALHDQLDPIMGYPEYAHITFFDIRASLSEITRSFQLDEFTMFEVMSTMPRSDFQTDLSWRFRISSDRVRNENCDFCRLTGITGGVGDTWAISRSPFGFFYFGVRGTAAYHEQDQFRLWAGAGPDARLRLRWTPELLTVLEAWYRFDLQGDQRRYFERSISTQYSWDHYQGIRLIYKDYDFDRVTSAQYFYYY